MRQPGTDTDYELEGYVLDFPAGGIASSTAFENNGYDPTETGGVGHGTAKAQSDTVKRLTATDFMTNNLARCDHLPDPDKADSRSMGWEFSPYFVGVEHPNWDPPARSNLDPTVFAKVPTNDGFEYRIHDRRFLPLENTLDNPLIDGGGTQTINSIYRDINAVRHETDDLVEERVKLILADHDENPRTPSRISGSEQAIFCSNGEPNIFNEESCVLSTEENACVREGADKEDTVVVTTLTETMLAALNVHLTQDCNGGGADCETLLAEGRPVMVRELSAADASDTKYPPPCEMDAVSRWVATADANQSACTQSDNSDTVAAFQHLLKYSVSNNDEVRDLRMVRSLCSPFIIEKHLIIQ